MMLSRSLWLSVHGYPTDSGRQHPSAADIDGWSPDTVGRVTVWDRPEFPWLFIRSSWKVLLIPLFPDTSPEVWRLRLTPGWILASRSPSALWISTRRVSARDSTSAHIRTRCWRMWESSRPSRTEGPL